MLSAFISLVGWFIIIIIQLSKREEWGKKPYRKYIILFSHQNKHQPNDCDYIFMENNLAKRKQTHFTS